MTDRQLFVYADLDGTPALVGRLWARVRRGRESATFEYDDTWLKHPSKFALEPALVLGKGPLHTSQGRQIFGAIGDSAPDRWGRVLIQRAERGKARQEIRPPHSLGEIDYLLAVSDIARQGALRFTETEGGPFLAPSTNIPPLIRLSELLGAAMRLDSNEASDDDLKLLLAPGSSLGGARPKASIIDRDGRLAMAKFPKQDDLVPVSRWEATALTLAKSSGISTPEWRIESIANRDVLLLQRFDRMPNAHRIPFLSAMSMLDASDHELHSYLEIADALRQYGALPAQDCAQLWRRVVFNILISNSDDHLRNHGFLYDPSGGWRLAPAYDLNPVPVDIKQRILTTTINEDDGTASVELALATASHYGLKPAQAKTIMREVGAAVSNWRNAAVGIGLSSHAIDRMSSAFEHAELTKATG
jgi:serine/threonine-protein kinase HipA